MLNYHLIMDNINRTIAIMSLPHYTSTLHPRSTTSPPPVASPVAPPGLHQRSRPSTPSRFVTRPPPRFLTASAAVSHCSTTSPSRLYHQSTTSLHDASITAPPPRSTLQHHLALPPHHQSVHQGSQVHITYHII